MAAAVAPFPDAVDGNRGHGRGRRAVGIRGRVLDHRQALVAERRQMDAAVAAMVQRDHGDAERAGDVRRPGVHTYIEIELRHQRRGRAQTELAGDGHRPAAKLLRQPRRLGAAFVAAEQDDMRIRMLREQPPAELGECNPPASRDRPWSESSPPESR